MMHSQGFQLLTSHHRKISQQKIKYIQNMQKMVDSRESILMCLHNTTEKYFDCLLLLANFYVRRNLWKS